MYFEGAILINYLCTDQTNPPFRKFSAVIWSEIDIVNKFE